MSGSKEDQAGCPFSGYLFSTLMHGGKSHNEKLLEKSGLKGAGITILKVVLLLAPYVDSGKIVVLDRGYGSVKMAYVLHRLGFRFEIMCRKQRKNAKADPKGLPYEHLGSSKVKGCITHSYCKELEMVAIRWVDSNQVYMLSNCSGPEVIQMVKRYDKKGNVDAAYDEPYAISLYQLLHGAIDKNDRRQNENGFNHKTHRWQQKLFYKTMMVMAVNMEILLGMKYPKFRDKSNTHRRICLSKALMTAAPSQKKRDHLYVSLNERVKQAKKMAINERYKGVLKHALLDPFNHRRQCMSCEKLQQKGFCQLCGKSFCFSRTECIEKHYATEHPEVVARPVASPDAQ